MIINNLHGSVFGEGLPQTYDGEVAARVDHNGPLYKVRLGQAMDVHFGDTPIDSYQLFDPFAIIKEEARGLATLACIDAGIDLTNSDNSGLLKKVRGTTIQGMRAAHDYLTAVTKGEV